MGEITRMHNEESGIGDLDMHMMFRAYMIVWRQEETYMNKMGANFDMKSQSYKRNKQEERVGGPWLHENWRKKDEKEKKRRNHLWTQ